MTYTLIVRPLLIAQSATLALFTSWLTSKRSGVRLASVCDLCAVECCKKRRSQTLFFAISKHGDLNEVSHMESREYWNV